MLVTNDFKRIARAGFGDPHNSHPWSMAWFKGKLYVGTVRDLLWLFGVSGYYSFLDPFPVELASILELDLRAQIWRYTPESDTWEKVYTSPLQRIRLRDIPRFVRHRQRRRGMRIGMLLRSLRGLLRTGLRSPLARIGRDIGYREMAVYTDRHGVEALYIATIGLQGHLLKTTDGVHFDLVSQPGLGLPTVRGLRPLVSFNGHLYTSPVGHSENPNITAFPMVYETDDPSRGLEDPSVWRPVSTPGFSDPGNRSIFEMAVFDDHLYAGTTNLSGFQIWKTDARGSPPYEWKRVVQDGGYRQPSSNLAAISMCPFGEWLYVGSGNAPSALDVLEPTPGELIRIAPDDTWEVVAGPARDTHQGHKQPVSGLQAGFGNPLAFYVWRLAGHSGWLYAGIHDSTTMLRYTPQSKLAPSLVRHLEQAGGKQLVLDTEGGADLWRTQDGTQWHRVTQNGFGNPFNQGIRTLQSSPAGLFVGCYNPFTEATDPSTGEPRGGTEVWLGTS